jgi:hypothetical protein
VYGWMEGGGEGGRNGYSGLKQGNQLT